VLPFANGVTTVSPFLLNSARRIKRAPAN
jgi:hypothetical protein